MTTGPRSQCAACRRLIPDLDAWHCEAFPQGIPDAVKSNDLDHREPVRGDHGIRFAAKAGDKFPTYAFA